MFTFHYHIFHLPLFVVAVAVVITIIFIIIKLLGILDCVCYRNNVYVNVFHEE